MHTHIHTYNNIKLDTAYKSNHVTTENIGIFGKPCCHSPIDYLAILSKVHIFTLKSKFAPILRDKLLHQCLLILHNCTIQILATSLQATATILDSCKEMSM